MDDVGAVDDVERLAHIVIGDQHADAAILQMLHQVADVVDGDRIDAGERLVQQDVGRMRRQRARDLDAAALAARQRDRRRVRDMGDREFRQQAVDHGVAQCAASGSTSSAAARMFSSAVRPRKIEASCGR